MKSRFDVVICGGGLSGLAAALRCSEEKLRVAVVERSSGLGGRCYSYLDARTGDIVENGQHVLLGAYHQTMKYLEIAGTRRFLRAQPVLQLPLLHPVRGYVPFAISSLPRPLHLTAGMLKFGLLSWNDRRKLLTVGMQLYGWNRTLEIKLRALTVEQWLRSLGQSDQALRCLWYPIAISVMNELPERASALLFARSLRKAFLGSKADSAVLLPTIGQTDLYVTPVEAILAQRHCMLFRNSEAIAVESTGDRVTGLRLKSGRVIAGGNIIAAVPYFVLGKILPEPLRETAPYSRCRHIPSSPIISVHLWFDEEITQLEYAGCIGKTVQWIFNRRNIILQKGRLPGYLSCIISGAHDLIGEPKEQIISRAVDDLNDLFGRGRHVRPVHAVVIKERRATFSPTNETEPMRPGTVTPLRNFFLSGDWTDTGLPATIEGAIASGFAAAEAVIRR